MRTMTTRPSVHAQASASVGFRTMGHIRGTDGNGRRRHAALEWHGVQRRSVDDAFPNSNEAFP